MNASEPQTYSDQRLDKISREVYFNAMTKCKAILDKDAVSDADIEKLKALSGVVDAASTRIIDQEDVE